MGLTCGQRSPGGHFKREEPDPSEAAEERSATAGAGGDLNFIQSSKEHGRWDLCKDLPKVT